MLNAKAQKVSPRSIHVFFHQETRKTVVPSSQHQFFEPEKSPNICFSNQNPEKSISFSSPPWCSPAAAVHVRSGEVIVSQSEQLLRRVEDLTAEEQLAAEDRRWGI
jgi:hypothetical protein